MTLEQCQELIRGFPASHQGLIQSIFDEGLQNYFWNDNSYAVYKSHYHSLEMSINGGLFSITPQLVQYTGDIIISKNAQPHSHRLLAASEQPSELHCEKIPYRRFGMVDICCIVDKQPELSLIERLIQFFSSLLAHS